MNRKSPSRACRSPCESSMSSKRTDALTYGVRCLGNRTTIAKNGSKVEVKHGGYFQCVVMAENVGLTPQIAVFCRRIMMNHWILSYTLRQAHVLLRKGTWTHNPTANMQINRSGTSNCCGLKSDSKPWQGLVGPNSQTIDNNCRCPENANCHPAHNLKISKDLQRTPKISKTLGHRPELQFFHRRLRGAPSSSFPPRLPAVATLVIFSGPNPPFSP